ncbi:hypothetical protein [Nannocystis bainbridge]|uniref:Uncharacterized protein n=1 Tax=Nannocystis bainbridge TaxID=2995303 RepID=A0ABT5DZ03_9BACT|nr:hypothetical protein [Nannocystis bainbridge]MDC0718804.1 hypothetical protein [Nannocystis bainbridge]
MLLGTWLLGPACVLPAGGATGLELTWSAREVNAVDGPEARRARTCLGTGLSRVAVQVVDAADPARDRVFAYACEAGNISPAARTVETPEIFLDLRAGTYDLTASGRATDDAPLAIALAVGEVESHAITLVDLELQRPPQQLDLALTGACGDLTVALRYADPAADLFLAEGDEPPALYRQALASDRGLRLGGQSQPCTGLAGAHRVQGLDPGRYRLDLEIDGRTCSRALAIEDSPVQIALDLENPACDG